MTAAVPSDGVAPQPRRLPILSVSRANRYRACPRADYFAAVLKRVSREVDSNRRFGTLFHLGLETWWRVFALGAATALSPLAAAIQSMREVPNADPFDMAKAEALMVGYDARWSSDPLEVVQVNGVPAVEIAFEGDLRNPQTSGVSRTFRRGGKIDAIVRAPDGQVYLLEHKTSAEDIGQGAMYWMRLTLDPQCSMYLQGARDLGLRPAGVIYDVIGKPDVRPLKATPIEARKYVKATGALYANQREHDETPAEYGTRVADRIVASPEAYYQRAYVVRSRNEEVEAEWDLWMTAQQIRESMAADVWPRNPKSCEQYRRLCDYFKVCTRQATIDDDRWYRTKEAV